MRRALAAIAVLGVFAFAFAACGIDEIGQLPGDASPDITVADVQNDVPPSDAGFDVAPLGCEEAGTPLDASCVGVGIPAGWTAIAYRENSSDCNGAPSFTLLTGITDASVPPGQCFCSDCTAVGSWTCTATLYTGPTCPQFATQYTASACDNQNGFHYGATVARSGDAGCSSGTQVDASITATPVSLCAPTSCSADFCGLVAQGFLGCVVNTNTPDAGCPSDFGVVHQVASSASAACACPQCAVTNASTATCTGTVTAYSTTSCGGTAVGTQALDGGCINLTTGYTSMYYDAGPTPTPTCQPATVATGTATLVAPTTVCCTK